ncbi:MAG: hypothetical protein V4662_10500 [Verrucomicrobiota bacterium]
MKHRWSRLILAAIFLMVQVSGVSASSTSCVRGTKAKAVHCTLGCCSGPVCECGMAPAQKPAEPAPAAPAPQSQSVKFMPLPVNVIMQSFAPLILQKPPRPLTLDAFLPHCPPALALHCALLL